MHIAENDPAMRLPNLKDDVPSCLQQPALPSEGPDIFCATILMQAASLGLGDEWQKVKKAYIMANRALGDIIKVQQPASRRKS